MNSCTFLESLDGGHAPTQAMTSDGDSTLTMTSDGDSTLTGIAH